MAAGTWAGEILIYRTDKDPGTVILVDVISTL